MPFTNSNMRQEIGQQPEVMALLIQMGQQMVKPLADEFRKRDIRFAMIAARGTSDNAAQYAKYRFEIELGIPVVLAAPSAFTLYGGKMNLSQTLVIGISQSGRGADVVEVVSAGRAAGALTAGITNDDTSELAQTAEYVLNCSCGVEKGFAATKTYTSTMALIALLVADLSGDDALPLLTQVKAGMEHALSIEDKIAQLAERYRYMRACFTLARGYNYCTAHEAALKMMETSGTLAKSYSAADFMHGPLSVANDGFPCFLFAPEGRGYATMLQLANTLKERRAEIIVYSDQPEIQQMATKCVKISGFKDERISPIAMIIYAQLFACHLTMTRGMNPDDSKGLSKVTITR